MSKEYISWSDYLKTLPEDKFIDGACIENETISGVEFTPTDDLSGFSLDSVKFADVKGFSAKHLAQLEFTSKTEFPENITDFTFSDFVDVVKSGKHEETKWPELEVPSNAQWEGLPLADMDISRFKGVTIEHIKQCKDLAGCKTPVVEVTKDDNFQGLSLTDTDISHWKGVTTEHLNQCDDLAGSKLPKINLHTLDMKGKSFFGVDFGESYGLTWEQCKQSTDLAEAKMPNMRIAKEYDKYVPDNAETRIALQNKCQPKKVVEEDFSIGDTDIHKADFSRVKGLSKLQVERIIALGGINANIDMQLEQNTEKARNVSKMAMQIAEIISPTPPDSDKERYRCPRWLVGPAQSLAWICEKQGLDPKEIANPLRNATPEQVQQKVDELREQNRKTQTQEVAR